MPSAAMKRSAHHLPGGRGKRAYSSDEGVGEHAERHGPHPAEPIAEPAEQDAARRRSIRNPAVAMPYQLLTSLRCRRDLRLFGVGIRFQGLGMRKGALSRSDLAQQFLERRPGDERKEPHFHAIERPGRGGRR